MVAVVGLITVGVYGARHAVEAKPVWVTVRLPDPPEPLPDEANPAKGITVELAVKEDSWVEVIADGTPAFAKLLRASDARSFEAAESIRLRLGNAGGVEALVNGKPVGPLGGRGQRLVIEFTAEGVRTLSRAAVSSSLTS